MEKLELIILARRFLKMHNITSELFEIDSMVEFAEHLMSTGVLLDAKEYSVRFHDAVKRVYGEGIEVGKLLSNNPFSSAGKEVMTLQECKDEYAKTIKGFKD